MATEHTRRTSKGIIEGLAKLAKKTATPLPQDHIDGFHRRWGKLQAFLAKTSDFSEEADADVYWNIHRCGGYFYETSIAGLSEEFVLDAIDFDMFCRAQVYSYQGKRRGVGTKFRFNRGYLSGWTTQMCLLARTERHGKDRTLNRLFDKYYVGQTYRYEPLYYARYFINEAEHDAELKRGVIKWFGLPPDASDEALLDKMWAHHFKHAHCDYDKQATDLYVTAPQCCIPFQIFYLADRMQIDLPDEFKPWADAFAKVEMVYDEITEQVEVAMAIRGIA